LIKRVTEEVKRMLTTVNINKVFIQSLILILFHFIKAARTSLLNILLSNRFLTNQLYFKDNVL